MEMIGIAVTVVTYLIAKYMYSRKNYVVLSPLIICPLIIVAFMLYFKVSYTNYYSGAHYLTELLQPATVAFAVPLYKYHKLVKKYVIEISIGVLGGSIIAILSSMVYGKLLNIDAQLIDSLAPRSVTTPLAMITSESIGGVPALTAVFVILTGLTGLFVGPMVVRILGLENELSKGMLLGMGAHACGTAKAYEMGSKEGAIASVTMIFAGIVTIVLAPHLVPVLMGALHIPLAVFNS